MATSMPLVLAEVETINIEEKEYTVEGYTLKQDLSNKKFTSEEIAHFLIDRYYICPICNKIQRGWALYEEKVNGIILRKFFLKCKHVFTSLAGLEVVDMEYKEMFVMWVRVETNNVQLIQRSDSILYPVMYWMNTWTGTSTPALSNTYSFVGTVFTTAGSPSSYTSPSPSMIGTSGDQRAGIVIGTGNAANTTSTYALQSQIQNGTGAGQMQYGSTNVASLVTSGNTVSFQVNRTFTNNSGASITVAEVGIYCFITTNQASGAVTTFAFARDVLATPVTVANTTPITVYYTIQLTIS